MEISNDKRVLLCRGMDYVIQEKEWEIEEVKKKTEKDFAAAKIASNFSHQPFSLEREKEKKIEKIHQEIREIKAFREEINSLKNHLLLVPNFIKLELSDKKG